MISAFPWYDFESVWWANDVVWRATELPGNFEHRVPVHELWHHPALLVTQACGLDLFLSDVPIEPVAVPVFDLDCRDGHYFSYVIGREEGRVAAVNALTSRSGMSALLTVCEPESLMVTGSHLSSLQAVAAGDADIVAVDAVSWKILERTHADLLDRVRVLGRTAEAQAPPFVVRRGASTFDVLAGLQRAMRSSATLDARAALHLKGVLPTTRGDYDAVFAEYLELKNRIPHNTRLVGL